MVKRTYQGDMWKQCVAKYKITARQLVDQFHMSEAHANGMIAGNFFRLPDPDDMKRLADWYAISKPDAKALDLEFDRNANAQKWNYGIDDVGVKRGDKPDRVRGEEYRKRAALFAKPSTVASAEKPDAIAKPSREKRAVAKEPDAAPPSPLVPPPQPAEDAPSSFVAKATVKPKRVPAEPEDENELPKIDKFRVMSKFKQVRSIILASGKPLQEIAPAIDVLPSTLDRFLKPPAHIKAYIAPAPIIMKNMIEALNVPKDYADALLDKKKTEKGDAAQDNPMHVHRRGRKSGQADAQAFYLADKEDAHER